MPPHAIQTERQWDVGTVEPKGTESDKADSDSDAAPTSRKSVSFRDTVFYREIAPLTEITEKEIAEVWYNDDEYAKIKKVVTATVKKAGNGDAIEESKGLCMRGLEGRTKFGARRRKNNKAAALTAVWETQVGQWKKKVNKPLAIAASYKPHATHAKYRAIEAGHSDQRFVNENIRGGS